MGMWDMPARHYMTDTELRFNPYHNPANGRFCSKNMLDTGGESVNKGIDNSSLKTYNYSSDEYSKMLMERTILSINDDVHSLPSEGKPNSIYDLTFTNNTVKQRRIIGGKGTASFDLDTTDHNQPWAHPTDAHKHYWENGRRMPDVLKFTDKELYDNSDIIKKGVNYHDKK